MRDPYLLADAKILRNLLGITDAETLQRAEADITAVRLLTVDGAVAALPFDFERLLAIHKHIFGDIYDWAGTVRTIPVVKGERVLGGDTVRYSQPDDIERDAKQAIREMNGANWPALDVRETAERFSELTAALWPGSSVPRGQYAFRNDLCGAVCRSARFSYGQNTPARQRGVCPRRAC
jgi:cell filamentation protein